MGKYKNDAKVFKAFCDENRLEILELLRSGEKCACVLLEDLEIAQSTLSHHMKILCDSGIVKSRKEGKWTHYAIDDSYAVHAQDLLMKTVKADNGAPKEDDRCCDCKETI